MSNKLPKRSIVVDDSNYFQKQQKNINPEDFEEEEEDDLPKLYEEFAQAKKKVKDDNKSNYSYNYDQENNKSEDISVDFLDDMDSVNKEKEKAKKEEEKKKKEEAKKDIKDLLEEKEERNTEQNEYILEDLFLKLKVSEWNICIFTLTSMLCSLIYHDVKTYPSDSIIKDKKLQDICINFCLIMTTISVIFFSKYIYHFIIIYNYLYMNFLL